LTEKTLFTEPGESFGTPEYMSPEQADLDNEDIDTLADIYSLGALLYVLLTGVSPLDTEQLRQGGIDHVRQTIRESDHKTPSTRDWPNWAQRQPMSPKAVIPMSRHWPGTCAVNWNGFRSKPYPNVVMPSKGIDSDTSCLPS